MDAGRDRLGEHTDVGRELARDDVLGKRSQVADLRAGQPGGDA